MTRVKICGLRDPDHARVAIEAGADLLGVVFADSRRRVTVDEARAIREVAGPRTVIFESTTDAVDAALSQRRPLLVGVFARQSPDEINRIAAAVDLDLVQLSGGEDPALARRLQRPVIRAVHISTVGDPAALAAGALRDAARGPAAITFLDTKSEQGGGAGVTFDWEVARRVAADRPIMLAGGLTPANVGDAVEQVRPWAVDVSSGVETNGAKDTAKIRAFLAAARAAEVKAS